MPQFELLAVGVPDGHIHDLGPGAGGAYSPHGSTIAYFDSGNLKLLNLTTGTRKTLAPPYYPLQGALAWAPNGRTIAYSEGDTGFIPDRLKPPLSMGRPDGSWVFYREASRHPCGLAACSCYPTEAASRKRHRCRKPNHRPHPRPPTTSGPERLSDFVAGPVSVLPGGTRIVYDVISPFPHPNNDLGLRTVSVTGCGDAPLVACRGRGHGDLVIGHQQTT